MNSRLDPIQAAVLRVKLKVLDNWTDRRRAVAAAYSKGLRETALILPHVPIWAEPVWHLYVVRTSNRDKLQGSLRDADIGTLIHYPIPPHMQSAYSGMAISGEELPLARDLANAVLSLPISPHLDLKALQSIIARIISECNR